MKNLIIGTGLAFLLSLSFVSVVQAHEDFAAKDKARFGSLLGNLSVSYDKGESATSKYLIKELSKLVNKQEATQ